MKRKIILYRILQVASYFLLFFMMWQFVGGYYFLCAENRNLREIVRIYESKLGGLTLPAKDRVALSRAKRSLETYPEPPLLPAHSFSVCLFLTVFGIFLNVWSTERLQAIKKRQEAEDEDAAS